LTSTQKSSKTLTRIKSAFVLELIFPLFETFQASSQSEPAEETTESSEWKVVGSANRTTLPQSILDFCGSSKIYEIEEGENPSDDTAPSQDSGKKTYNIISCNTVT
jgi:hypothetical protein